MATKAPDRVADPLMSGHMEFRYTSVKKEKYADLVCAAIHLDVKDGIATSTRGIAIQTKTRKALRVSLGDIAARFAKVSGTFSEPKVVLSNKKAIFQSSATWATGGVFLLAEGLWDRITAEKNPCAKVLEKKD